MLPIDIQEKVSTKGLGMDMVRYTPRHHFQHCEDDPVYEPVHLREYNIKLQSAMQRGSFIKSFHPALATLCESMVYSVKDDRTCRSLSDLFVIRPSVR